MDARQASVFGASPYDFANYADYTRKLYGNLQRHYQQAAARVGMDDKRPDFKWFRNYLINAQRRSPSAAKKTLNALSSYFQQHGVDDLTQRDEIRLLLFPGSRNRLCPNSDYRRAQYYAEHEYCAGYQRRIDDIGAIWQVYARSHGFDQFHGTGLQAANFLAGRGWDRSWSSIRNDCTTLSAYRDDMELTT